MIISIFSNYLSAPFIIFSTKLNNLYNIIPKYSEKFAKYQKIYSIETEFNKNINESCKIILI